MESSEQFIRHGPCKKCGSSDGVGWYADGHGWCFVCSKPANKKEAREASERESMENDNLPTGSNRHSSDRNSNEKMTPVTDVFRAIPRRGLSEEAIRKFGIDVCMDKTVDVAHRYPYFKDGVHVANKVRKRTEKSFYWEGNPRNAELFGQHLFPPGSADGITVVEGELDTPSAWVLLGSRYPVVSVPSCGHALKSIKSNYEYLNSFKKIVFCFDDDEVGRKTAKACAALFEPGKCAILTLQEGKDPNEYRVKGVDPKAFQREWWKAPKIRPDGLKAGNTMWEEIVNRPSYFSIDYPWLPLNKKTYGIRLSEAVLLMADTGVGKTSIFKEIEHAILMDPTVIEKGYGVGFLHLEEPNFETALGLLSIENDKPYHLPDTDRTEEELRLAYDRVLNNERSIFYDHFGSNEIDEILAKVRFMSVMGCKYIFIDHLSIIVSDQSGDERKQLDEISTKLKTLTMELNIAVFCVIHTNRNGQARGSAGPEKVANIHLSLHRELKDSDPWRRNVLKIEIEKNRFSGRTGPCLWLYYDENTGRLVELDEEAIQKYENGVSINDSDMPF